MPNWGATIALDASAAREVFRHVRVEVLVVDVNLPGILGLELLALLRHDPQWDEPPVLLMSAHPEQAGIAVAMRDGLVTRFLRKPFASITSSPSSTRRWRRPQAARRRVGVRRGPIIVGNETRPVHPITRDAPWRDTAGRPTRARKDPYESGPLRTLRGLLVVID